MESVLKLAEERKKESEGVTWGRLERLLARIADMNYTASFFPVLDQTPICSEIYVWICHRVWPTYNVPQHWDFNLYTTCELIAKGIRYFKGKGWRVGMAGGRRYFNICSFYQLDLFHSELQTLNTSFFLITDILLSFLINACKHLLTNCVQEETYSLASIGAYGTFIRNLTYAKASSSPSSYPCLITLHLAASG